MKRFIFLFFVLVSSIFLNDVTAQWSANGNHIYNFNTGFVGISTDSPVTLLHAAKNMTEPAITVQNLGGTGGATFRMWDNASGADWKFKATLYGGFKIRDNANGLDVIVIEPNGFANALYIKANGSIGIGTSSPQSSALMDINTSNKGILIPRLTESQRDAILSPVDGLLVFNLTTGCIDYFLGGSWKSFCGSTEPEFQCGMKIQDTRDGKMYNTVLIGTQCWMAENLNIGSMIFGTQSPENNEIIEKICYDDNETNCAIYGGLYQWDESMGYSTQEGDQGICMTGWHIPSDAEWKLLEGSVDSFYDFGDPEWDNTGSRGYDAAYNLKTKTGWSIDGNGINKYGFSALPAGYQDYGNFSGIGAAAYFWTSTLNYPNTAWARGLSYLKNQVDRYEDGYFFTARFSVRCIKD